MYCRTCHDGGYVCESHPELPWADAPDTPHTNQVTCDCACACGGAGMPCPSCCSPIPENRNVSVRWAYVPDRFRPPELTVKAQH